MFLVWLCLLWGWMDTVRLLTHLSSNENYINYVAFERFDVYGVKRCHQKCTTRSSCMSIGYNIDTMVCYLLNIELDGIEERGKLMLMPKRKVSVHDGPCAVKIGKDMICLVNRKGKVVFVKAFSEMTCAQDIPTHTDWVMQARNHKETKNHIHRAHRSQSNTYLHDACRDGDLCRVKYILSEGDADINTGDEDGMTPLMIAAQKADIQVFYCLVVQGASMSILNFAQANILHLACEGGNIQIVKFVLQQNATDINSRRKDGFTPAMVAVHEGHGMVFNLLVSKGVDLTLCDDKGFTIVNLALEAGNNEVVKYLFKHNRVAINKKYNNFTPAMYAAVNGKLDLFNFLVRKGANLTIDDTILHKACKGGNIDIVKQVLAQNIHAINRTNDWGRTAAMEAAAAGHSDVFDFLMMKGTDLSLSDLEEANVLHLASESGNIDIVKIILRKQIEYINAIDDEGLSPAMKAASKAHSEIFFLLVSKCAHINKNNVCEDNLHLACQGGNVDIVKYFLTQYSADINKRDNRGWTPAMYATHKGHIEVLHLLASKGADLIQKDGNHEDILSLAVFSGNPAIVKYILKNNFVDINRENDKGMTPVMLATFQDNAEVFHLLVSKGADLTRVNNERENILHIACHGSMLEIVDYILTQNIVEDIDTRTRTGQTPLMFAAAHGNKDVFDFLVTKGANLTLLDKDDNNILHFASEGGNIEIVQFILSQHIVDINSRSNKGRTAVMFAAENGNRAVFHLLMENGANSTFRDKNGKDILCFASEGDNFNIVKYIITGNKGLRYDTNEAILEAESERIVELLRQY